MNTKTANKDREELREKRKRFLSPNHLYYYTEPLDLDYGENGHVYDYHGNQYLDFFGGILSTSVGHNRQEVSEAIQEQAKKLIHSSTLYLNEPHTLLAERLAKIAPGKIEVSYFTASGSEADETAVMLARTHTGHHDIIALRHGYSGRGAVGLSLTAHSNWRSHHTEVTGIKHAINPYCYRCPLKMSYPSCGVACAEDLEDVIKTTTPGKVAAFLVEPIQGVGGFITPPPEYLKIAHEIIKNHEGLFISDEVQTGFGRTGSKWFGIEHSGVQPDIMTMAKGIANGMPLANTMTTQDIARSTVSAGTTLSTFGGNPVSCAAGLGVMDVLEKEATPDHVELMGSLLREGLERIQEQSPILGEVRGMGLMLGLEIVKDKLTREPYPEGTSQLLEAAKHHGLLIGKGGLYGNVIRLAPPLTASEEDIGEALEKLEKTFKEVN